MEDSGGRLLAARSDGHVSARTPAIGVHLSHGAAVGVVTGPRDLVPHGGVGAEVPIEDTSVSHVVAATASLIDELASCLASTEGVEVGLALGGHVDPSAGTVVLSNDFRDRERWWAGVPLAARVTDATGLPVRLINDANALAVDNHRNDGAHAADNSAVVLVGEYGLGCGLVINGQLVLGARGISGEIGHLPVSGKVEPCRCGGSHCLERVVTLAAIEGQLVAIKDSDDFLSYDRIRAAEVAVFERAGRALGHALVMLINLVNPHSIVVYAPTAILDEPKFMEAATATAALCSFSDAGAFCQIYGRPLHPIAMARGAAVYVQSLARASHRR